MSPPQNAAAPIPKDEGGQAMSFGGDSEHSPTTVNLADVDWGAVLDCVQSCSERGDCSWRPFECRLLGGAS